MAMVAGVEDGKVISSASQDSLSKANQASNGMDKDAFLQLLVAEMQYQDPLEPTSNTEYIAQYAQFSQVESLSNMASTMDLTRASSLVGEEVYIKTTNANGEANYVRGKVDYVVYEGNKAYLSINEQLYSLDDLDTVVDRDYIKAYDGAEDFTKRLNKLPAVANIAISTEGKIIDDLNEQYSAMSDYDKSFVAMDTVKRLEAYTAKLNELRAAALTQDTDKEAEPEADSVE